jgi:hypothetical protein
MITSTNKLISGSLQDHVSGTSWSQRLVEAVRHHDHDSISRIVKEEGIADDESCELVVKLCVEEALATTDDEPSATLQALTRFSGFCATSIPNFVMTQQGLAVDQQAQLVKAFLQNGYAPVLPECEAKVESRIADLIEKHDRALQVEFRDQVEKKLVKHAMQEYRPFPCEKRSETISLNEEIVAREGIEFNCSHFDAFVRGQAAEHIEDVLNDFACRESTRKALYQETYETLQAAYDSPTLSVQCSDAALGRAIHALAACLKNGDAASYGVRINGDGTQAGHQLTLVLQKEKGSVAIMLHDSDITANAAPIRFPAHGENGISSLTLSSFLKIDHPIFDGTFSLLSVPAWFVERYSGELVDMTDDDRVKSIADALMDNNTLHLKRIGALLAHDSTSAMSTIRKHEAKLGIALNKALYKGFEESVRAYGSLLLGSATMDDEKSYAAHHLLCGIDDAMNGGDSLALRACGDILLSRDIGPERMLDLLMTRRGSPATYGLIRALATGNAMAVHLYAKLLLRAKVSAKQLLTLMEIKNENGQTIIHHALQKAYGDAVRACCELLVQAGVKEEKLLNLFIPGNKGDGWILQTAMDTRRTDIVHAFAQAVEVIARHLPGQQRKRLLARIRETHGAYKWYTLWLIRINKQSYQLMKKNDPEFYQTFKQMKSNLK